MGQCLIATIGADGRVACTIVRRDAVFLLRDHSSNGTFVTLRGQSEVCVRDGELGLAGAGRIALGQPAAAAACSIAFTCEWPK